MIRIKKSQDEITDLNGPQAYVDESVLIDNLTIENLNKIINNLYQVKVNALNTAKDHKEIDNYLNLEFQNINMMKHQIELKLRYLKLTRVTKKIQEIVTGREEVNQDQLGLVYDQKKKNLEENKNKRVLTMQSKLEEIKNEIEKKKRENYDFTLKLTKLAENVDLKEQIIMLDSDDKPYAGDENQNAIKKYLKPNFRNKSLEIAQVTKLKNLVQQYYEEIEYLRAELDKLRARTFPSFLQKPDQFVYPDEK